MSITALLRRADQPAVHLRRIREAVADFRTQPEPQSQPQPLVTPIQVETLLDAALNARLVLIASGRARKPVVGKPSLDTTLINAVEAAITDR